MTTSSPSRSLHLVDLENLLGNPRADAPTALATFDAYRALAAWESDDHIIMATNPWLMGKIAFDLAVPASVHTAHGRDGADLMLLSHAPTELVVKRYARLVIGSGDGIFAARARAVQKEGVAVDVIARADGCATRLRRFDCTFFQPVSTDVVLAA